jgi:hypothetical protein
MILLTIAILSGINYIASAFGYLVKGRIDVNLFPAAIFVLSVWHSCFPLAIIVMILTILVGIVGAAVNPPIERK